MDGSLDERDSIGEVSNASWVNSECLGEYVCVSVPTGLYSPGYRGG